MPRGSMTCSSSPRVKLKGAYFGLDSCFPPLLPSFCLILHRIVSTPCAPLVQSGFGPLLSTTGPSLGQSLAPTTVGSLQVLVVPSGFGHCFQSCFVWLAELVASYGLGWPCITSTIASWTQAWRTFLLDSSCRVFVRIWERLSVLMHIARDIRYCLR